MSMTMTRVIRDETETDFVNLRRVIYLTLMSSCGFEEAGHKLLRLINGNEEKEKEVCIMLLECCRQQGIYRPFYALLAQRLCMIKKKVYQVMFDDCFVHHYSTAHRLDTNAIQNVAKYFAHLLAHDALPWRCLTSVRLTEEDTTSSSRIFIKFLFQELSEHLGVCLLNQRLTNEQQPSGIFDHSIFPKDNPKNTRFAINFFTSISLGGISENLRIHLKNSAAAAGYHQATRPRVRPQSSLSIQGGRSDHTDLHHNKRRRN
ncbi:hypothetical protein OROMI_033716 [Orobanche minor]